MLKTEEEPSLTFGRWRRSLRVPHFRLWETIFTFVGSLMASLIMRHEVSVLASTTIIAWNTKVGTCTCMPSWHLHLDGLDTTMGREDGRRWEALAFGAGTTGRF